MIEETALVKSVDGSLINVVTVQSSACQQCNESTTCSTSVLSKFFGNKEIELQLESEVSLEEGDQVMLGIEEKMLLRLTMLIYLAPLFGLFLFALAGGFIETFLALKTELLSVAMGVLGLVGGYFFIRIYIEKYLDPQNIKPVILKKL